MHFIETKENKDRILRLGIHAPSGYKYIVAHAPIGFRVGYVQIPKGHPWFGVEYVVGWGDDAPLMNPNVHGGVTFSERGVDENRMELDEWWIGFDCGHAGDAVDVELQDPEYGASVLDFELFTDGVVRSTGYVQRECFSLILQAVEAGKWRSRCKRLFVISAIRLSQRISHLRESLWSFLTETSSRFKSILQRLKDRRSV